MIKKILHIISDTNIGGAGKLLLVFLANFNREEFNICVVVPRGAKLIPAIKALNIRVIEFDGIGDRSLALGAINGLVKLYKSESPDIIHSHASLSARIAAKIAKKKIVHTRHSVYDKQTAGTEHNYKKKFPYKQLAGALNSSLSDKIIATSPAAKINLTETGTKQGKTVMIYNAIDPLEPLAEADKMAYRHKYGIKDGDFVCVMVARLEKVKGHQYVIKAAQLVQKQDPNVKFIFVGEGSLSDELKTMTEYLKLENVIFTGFMEDVGEALGIADVQINASYSETTNLALLEGMSLGLPAIATDTGGNPFVINDGVNGVLFDMGDYADLAKAILNLKADGGEYAHLSQRSKEIFNERFTAPVMTAKVEDVYKSL